MSDFGRILPRVRVPPPGPVSRSLGQRLARVESRNITRIAEDWPVFWRRAAGANVEDVDGNVYVDLTAGFAVTAAGHAPPEVAHAIARQAGRLPHGMGDVHPAEVKVALLERIAAIMPDGLDVAILGGAGADAVEAALKTAMLHTGRGGVIAFRGGYHGLTLGTLAVTDRPEFRAPFHSHVFEGVQFAPYPSAAGEAGPALLEVRHMLRTAESSAHPVGCILVEPVQGRGGIVVPPADFLPGLRRLCDEHGILLIVDEIYTGLGRTGRWLACEHTGVVPDVVTIGKALTGSLQLSAAVGRRDIMDAWPRSEGEAIHTSTFLGNPVACAAALAQLELIEREGLVQRAASMGARLLDRIGSWPERLPGVAAVRGAGLMYGIVLEAHGGRSAPQRVGQVVMDALGSGVLVLGEGPAGDVVALTPPLVITEAQLEHALGTIERALGDDGGPAPAGRAARTD